MTVAVTGGTGFVGSRFIAEALRSGHRVKALTRRPQEPRPGVDWVDGSLSDADSLRRLAENSDAIVHIAGVINARDVSEFERGNVEGTLAMLAAATASGVTRFVHVSSLAAREPELSRYGASKARSEELVRGSGLDWAIVRPPAIYGPGDRETLDLFKIASIGLMLLPLEGRVSLIHVDDLCRLLLGLAVAAERGQALFEADDGRENGWSHRELARAIGEAVGRRNLTLSVPRAMLKLGGIIDQLVRRERAKLSPDRAAVFSHRDWAVSDRLRPPPDLWRPEIATRHGLSETAAWYRAVGWL